jgi:hypothetical protein
MDKCRVHFLDPKGDHTALRPTASCKDYDELKDERGEMYAIVSYRSGDRTETFVPFAMWQDTQWQEIGIARQVTHERDTAIADLISMPAIRSKWPRRRSLFFSYLAAVCTVGAWGLALVIYLLTLYIAYLSGFVFMLLTFFFPVAGQIYWILVLWATTGSFLNTLTCLVWVALALSALIFGVISSRDDTALAPAE